MKISVITPCYNSAQTLHRTYMSLVKQKGVDFEWLLIDDCSSDSGETRRLIKELSNKAPFVVKYKFLEKNYFGSRSVYEACLLAEGVYACILDHDDQLIDNILSKIVFLLDKYKSATDLAGVCGRCVDMNGSFVGKPFNNHEQISCEGDIRFKQKITGELFQFTKINLLRDFFSQVKPGYTNGYVWAKISDSFNYIYVNEVFRIYDTELVTSYSNSREAVVRFPASKAEALLSTLETYNKYLLFNFVYSLKISGSAIRHVLNAKKSIFLLRPKKKVSLFFYLLSIPLGFIKRYVVA